MQNNLALGETVEDAPARLPGPVTLQGRFGQVERLDTKRHGISLWQAIAGQDEIWAYLKAGPFAGEKSFLAYLEEREALSDPYAYAIVDKDGKAKGFSCYAAIRPDMRVIEVGYIFYSPALQRTPLGTEAQYLLMKYAFEELGYRRYEWKCNALNAKSRNAAARYGFTFEGVFRQVEIIKGHNRDTAWYSIIDKEWPAVKQNFERGLKPENFDEQGKQKTPLR